MNGGVRTGEFVLFLRFTWFVLCGNQLNTPKKLDERDQRDPRHAPRNVGLAELAIILNVRLAVMDGVGYSRNMRTTAAAARRTIPASEIRRREMCDWKTWSSFLLEFKGMP